MNDIGDFVRFMHAERLNNRFYRVTAVSCRRGARRTRIGKIPEKPRRTERTPAPPSKYKSFEEMPQELQEKRHEIAEKRRRKYNRKGMEEAMRFALLYDRNGSLNRREFDRYIPEPLVESLSAYLYYPAWKLRIIEFMAFRQM